MTDFLHWDFLGKKVWSLSRIFTRTPAQPHWQILGLRLNIASMDNLSRSGMNIWLLLWLKIIEKGKYKI